MKIMVPFDGSSPAQRAVEYAIRIATSVGKQTVKVFLLNVQEADSAVTDFFARDATEVGARLASTRRQAGAKLLAGPTETLERAGVPSEAVVLLGDPATVSASYVDNYHCDMVVMGTRGLGPVGGLVLGSVASKVIHLVKVPVTVVK